MYIQLHKDSDIPKIQKQSMYPTQYVVEFIHDNPKAKLKLKKDAFKLLEHIEVVKEARKLYAEGKVMTWEEFLRNES